MVLRYHESSSTTELVLRKPTTRYFDQFLSLRCAVDLITYGLFPNAKEITESLAAVRAVFLHSGLDRKDPRIHAVCVGDGGTPRTAAALAFRTAWKCHSVDPLLNRDRIEYWEDRAAVAIPCCGYVHEAPGLGLQAQYEDWGIWSERRTVKAWALSR